MNRLAEEGASRLRRVVRQMLTSTPMLASLALRMEIRPDRPKQGGSPPVETIMADGVAIRFNPRWGATADERDLKAGLGHVVLACGLRHHLRRGQRDYAKWQRASHEVTAPVLNELGGFPQDIAGMPDKTAEEAYALLPDQQDESHSWGQVGEVGDAPPQGAAEGQGGEPGEGDEEGLPVPGKGQRQADGEPQRMTESQRAAAEREWEVAMMQAAQLQERHEAGRGAGNASGLVRRASESRMSWRDLLREFMFARASDDYSWSRPNRRMIASGLYLPALHSVKMGPVVFAVDTSGSMGSGEAALLQAVWSELRGVADQATPESVRLIECDHRVQIDEELDPLFLPETLPIRGGGGTSFRPVFDRLREDERQAACVIYFTDLYCHDFGRDPGVPVLWANFGDRRANPPFGRVVQIIPEGV